jgi:hypothetical protein
MAGTTEGVAVTVTTLYHTTNAADEILTGGFRDGEGSYMFVGITLRGVFLAGSPVDGNEGAKGDQVLEVAIPSNVELDEYAIEEEGRPVWEWCVPADVINRHARVRLLSEEELDAILDLRAARGAAVWAGLLSEEEKLDAILDLRAGRHAAAVEALREARRADEQATSRYGVPSTHPRVEHDGQPVDLD